VKPLNFPLFVDENIGADVVEGLRARHFDVRTAAEEGLIGRPDAEVLDRATSQGRVVITHDLGFGRSAVTAGAAFVGIIYLRPGHASSAFVLGVIDTLHNSDVEVEPPFVAVAERQQATIRVRTRVAPPW
jgi:predicted nuclease of predicted toxin-antitoxin system